MNILFFLTPKSEVAYISEDDTLRQALEKMEYHKYSAVPIVSRTGRYVGTLTEGDLLWGIKNQFNLDLKSAEKIPVTAIRRRLDNRPVKADANMEDLIGKALNQNFVQMCIRDSSQGGNPGQGNCGADSAVQPQGDGHHLLQVRESGCDHPGRAEDDLSLIHI